MIECKCGRRYKYSRSSGHTKTRCNSCLVNDRRFDRKIKCIEYMGGKCKRCGYDKCKRALAFHHLDPKTKSFNISGCHTRKWSEVQKELDKCIMLCHNCHAEEHESIDSNP